MQGLLALLLACMAWLLLVRPGARPRRGTGSRCRPGAKKARCTLEFAARLELPRAVEDALQRGVPLYFVAEAQLLRSRWYWRDGAWPVCSAPGAWPTSR
jgi:hypothetical protein